MQVVLVVVFSLLAFGLLFWATGAGVVNAKEIAGTLLSHIVHGNCAYFGRQRSEMYGSCCCLACAAASTGSSRASKPVPGTPAKASSDEGATSNGKFLFLDVCSSGTRTVRTKRVAVSHPLANAACSALLMPRVSAQGRPHHRGTHPTKFDTRFPAPDLQTPAACRTESASTLTGTSRLSLRKVDSSYMG